MKHRQIQGLPGASHFLVTGSQALEHQGKISMNVPGKMHTGPWCSSQGSARLCHPVTQPEWHLTAALPTDLLSTATNERLLKFCTFFSVLPPIPPRHSKWVCSNRLHMQFWSQISAITKQYWHCQLRWRPSNPGSLSFQSQEFSFEDGTKRLIFSWERSPVYSAELANFNGTLFLKSGKAFGYLAQGFIFVFQMCVLCSEILLLNPLLCSYFNIDPTQRLVVVPSFTPFPSTFL